MIKRTIQKLTEMMTILNEVKPFEQVEICGVSIDSRKIEKGNLFVPFKGANSDGHKFVEAAIQDGAAAALWQKDVPNPPAGLPILLVDNTLEALQQLSRSYRDELSVKVVGITGSNGKTTTKDMTANLLALSYKVQKTEGNFNNHIGLPLTLLRLEEDTDIAVVEMGMSALGEIEFLSKLAKPDVVIITNIGESHLQDLGSRENIAKAKLEIIEGISDNGLIVYNGDEPLLSDSLSHYKGSAELQTFGRSSENTLYPVLIAQKDDGSSFTINKDTQEYHLPVLGTHNILNALGSMLIANHFGIPFEKMNEGFSHLQLTSMRMELVPGGKGEKIINDAYNASPTSMRAAIDLVTSLSGYEKKILVLGDMLELGPNEVNFHYEIGSGVNKEAIDYVFTYGELGGSIADGAKSVLPEDRVKAYVNKTELITELKKHTDEKTLVLVKASRGMRLEEVVHELQK
ncbi:UDP-N-acetylmuramoyl-tripeptide--D-alanyl-D-alanine ligase [Robertmurraya korlensis]|uniref:UDP-N-acetylmuramoyl-tripeptide--D-alanyl-D- alanine ligase n=1 Tax=Robertmurraya korlensis TaxID=519977 RepID=UPI00082449B4|nr:UDP-N-acetylmuramoyl-tripeptide--D-alanyl-D-alanine ligase [Robertmurraya korlensis]